MRLWIATNHLIAASIPEAVLKRSTDILDRGVFSKEGYDLEESTSEESINLKDSDLEDCQDSKSASKKSYIPGRRHGRKQKKAVWSRDERSGDEKSGEASADDTSPNGSHSSIEVGYSPALQSSPQGQPSNSLSYRDLEGPNAFSLTLGRLKSLKFKDLPLERVTQPEDKITPAKKKSSWGVLRKVLWKKGTTK
ncbi:hypothetical protein CPB86DRAFT_820345 [Serendipita vermifera]|nr:hypothetical protein CPB86DRAFT_820345 [Serendipita vermifera]